MLRFIVCDDNEKIVDDVSHIINNIMMPFDLEYRIHKFVSFNQTFQKIIEDTSDQKIYILDIELPKISGIEIASNIRKHDWNSIILFLTSHNECKNDVFSERLMVLDYISKLGLYNKRLEQDIDTALDTFNKKKLLIFKFCNITYRIPYNEILYIESTFGKKCIIITESGKKIQLLSSLKKLLAQLGPNFFLSHKSCIINIDKVANIDFTRNIVTFTNGVSEVLISNRNRKALDEYVRNYR